MKRTILHFFIAFFNNCMKFQGVLNEIESYNLILFEVTGELVT